MKYVVGIDLGTSAVKTLLVNQQGDVCGEISKEYPLFQPHSGYSEQDPEDWVKQTAAALKDLVALAGVDSSDIEGLSYSGQMHGLVLLDREHKVLRNAILWNDTRTSQQCKQITSVLGDRLLAITRNVALEGFTLPKLLWVKQHEPELFREAATFLLPKDYVRFRMTNHIGMDYSDAAGTLLLNVTDHSWSEEICALLGVPVSLCPPLLESSAEVSTITAEFAALCNLSPQTKVFAGGADNACGAVGAGILSDGQTMCSIGTSGVVLSYEDQTNRDFQGKVHFFNHAKKDTYYTMGVTLAAGYSLSWLKRTFAPGESYDEFLQGVANAPIGSNGLVYTPYLVGERTPYADAMIRGSFVGMDGSHQRADFVRAVMEGITMSLNDSIALFRGEGKNITTIVSIGGGAKNEQWLQMQADIFDATVVQLENEQGPGMGAAMLAAVGCGWFDSLETCAKAFIRTAKEYQPNPESVKKYRDLYQIYTAVYPATRGLCEALHEFRRQ